jgi:hypothetical protein
MYPDRGGPIERQRMSLKNAALAGDACDFTTVAGASESIMTDSKATVNREAHDALAATFDSSARMRNPRWVSVQATCG